MAGAERLSSSLRAVRPTICAGRIGKAELPAAAPSPSGFWLKPPASLSLRRRKVQGFGVFLLVVFFFSPRVCYFLVVIITDRSATLGGVAGDILQRWVPRLAKCLLVN